MPRNYTRYLQQGRIKYSVHLILILIVLPRWHYKLLLLYDRNIEFRIFKLIAYVC